MLTGAGGPLLGRQAVPGIFDGCASMGFAFASGLIGLIARYRFACNTTIIVSPQGGAFYSRFGRPSGEAGGFPPARWWPPSIWAAS